MIKHVDWGKERTPTWGSETSLHPGLCWGSQAHPNLPGFYLGPQRKSEMYYRRIFHFGATYFFTVNLADRSSSLLVDRIDSLRSVVGEVYRAHPFEIIAWVVLPEHLGTGRPLIESRTQETLFVPSSG
uniref:Uncharacterized protein n=2 Tax=Candidatus Kentrum sp. UNK TaxID=2126344 RepID=A0A451A1J1_9GAMM|nr:MAG: hypothetical protein BECKUNK1418G_GA0071005_100935 [Candidatus Kentron sp. UNK]